MKKLILMITCFFLVGCATLSDVGTAHWHKNRLQEIETAYQSGDLEKEEYLSLKNEADQIREKHISEKPRYCIYCSGYHYSYYQGRRFPYYRSYRYSHSRHYGYRYRHGHHYGRHHYGYYH